MHRSHRIRLPKHLPAYDAFRRCLTTQIWRSRLRETASRSSYLRRGSSPSPSPSSATSRPSCPPPRSLTCTSRGSLTRRQFCWGWDAHGTHRSHGRKNIAEYVSKRALAGPHYAWIVRVTFVLQLLTFLVTLFYHRVRNPCNLIARPWGTLRRAGSPVTAKRSHCATIGRFGALRAVCLVVVRARGASRVASVVAVSGPRGSGSGSVRMSSCSSCCDAVAQIAAAASQPPLGLWRREALGSFGAGAGEALLRREVVGKFTGNRRIRRINRISWLKWDGTINNRSLVLTVSHIAGPAFNIPTTSRQRESSATRGSRTTKAVARGSGPGTRFSPEAGLAQSRAPSPICIGNLGATWLRRAGSRAGAFGARAHCRLTRLCAGGL